MAYIGRTTDGFGVRQRFLFTPDAGATSVSGTDASGATLTFSDSVYMDVYLNGVLLKAGTDYNTNTANTIAGLTATVANDEVTVLVYDIFTTADMVSATSGGTFTGAVTLSGGVTGDLDLNTDSATIKFGADDDVTVTHDPDDGLILKSTATADDNPFLLTLQTGETNLEANDVIGKIQFQAPDEGTGVDAILVNAAIQAVAEGDFSASSNATSLQFMTGFSGAADTKMTLAGNGDLTVGTDGLFVDISANAVGIGTASPNLVNSGDTQLDVRSDGTYAFFSIGKTATITSGDIAYMEFMNGNNNRMASIAGGADGANNDGYMRFSTLSGGSYTEAMRIDHDGDVKIVKGDIFFGASGKGINLGVTSNTDSNTLDDYEEGTWTASQSVGGNSSISASDQQYVKVGRMVHISLTISFSGSDVDRVSIAGLPFTATNSAAISTFFAGNAFSDFKVLVSGNTMLGSNTGGDANYTSVNGMTARFSGTYMATS